MPAPNKNEKNKNDAQGPTTDTGQVVNSTSGGSHDNKKVPDSQIQGTKAGERMRNQADGGNRPKQA